MKHWLFFLGSILIYLFLPATSLFAAQNLLINEFLPHPSSGNDWIEIYNPNTEEVDISGYKLNDSASQIKEITDSKIGAKCFVVFEVSNRLNNGGDSVYLYDKNGNQQDLQSYSTDPGLDNSWQRKPDGGSWQVLANLTKGSSNNSVNNCNQVVNQASTQSINIELSEFMPNPVDGSEWVEIYNKNNYSSDVSGYKIDDIDGGSSPFPIEEGTVIPALGFWLLEIGNARFNNEGDSIRLLDNSGNILESFDYTKSSAGNSFAKSNGQWNQTTTPTKNDVNKITSPPEAQEEKQTTKNESNKPLASYPTPTSSPTSNQVLGTKVETPKQSTNEGEVRNFTYSLDKVEATEVSSLDSNSSSSYPIGIIAIFWGVVVLLVVGMILRQRGFFDKIKLR